MESKMYLCQQAMFIREVNVAVKKLKLKCIQKFL